VRRSVVGVPPIEFVFRSPDIQQSQFDSASFDVVRSEPVVCTRGTRKIRAATSDLDRPHMSRLVLDLDGGISVLVIDNAPGSANQSKACECAYSFPDH
jgi:hypothetical protein